MTQKQATAVELPDESWISSWQLTQAIAEAFFPDLRRGSGVALIRNKTSRSGVAAGLPFLLTDADRTLLKLCARKLPKLTVEISDSVWTAFLKEFEQVLPDLDWIPCRPSQADLYADYVAGQQIAVDHLESLRALLRGGQITAINDHKASACEIEPSTMISRADLQKYFAERQISFVFARTPPTAMLDVKLPDLLLDSIERPLEQISAPIEQFLPAELELVPREHTQSLTSEGFTSEGQTATSPSNRKTRRFTSEELDVFERRIVNGETLQAIGAGLLPPLSVKGLERHLTRSRKETRAQQSQAAPRDAFGKMTDNMTRSRKGQ
jgi:hypothetical protein